ncbi:hypothetical protein E4U53_002119 [Claviceps sorghi]|nr:hypothetical protein E4U53_002119 [Claviceps sorghi]
MPRNNSVTEYAVLPLRPRQPPDLVDTLAQCQAIQDAWVGGHRPSGREPDTSLSSMYLDQGSRPALLITAPWDGISGHEEWMRTRENEVCKAMLGGYVQDDAVRLVHLRPAGREGTLRGPFVARDVNVVRIVVEEAERDTLQGLYAELEDEVRGRGGRRLWGGWRVEEAQGKEELVVFWTDEVPGHSVARLMAMGSEVEERRFAHMM